MAQSSVFREFITALRRNWRSVLPSVLPMQQSFAPMLPKASTFYAGVSPVNGMHVFVNFQHSCKAWEVGQFTINIVLSRRAEPERLGTGMSFAPSAGMLSHEGCYRIGDLLGGRDKWWHLREDRPPIGTVAWRPTNYADRTGAITEAVVSVTADVVAALRRAGIEVVTSAAASEE